MVSSDFRIWYRYNKNWKQSWEYPAGSLVENTTLVLWSCVSFLCLTWSLHNIYIWDTCGSICENINTLRPKTCLNVMNSQYMFIIFGQLKGSYFLKEPSWDSMLGRSWVPSQLWSSPLVIEGGPLVPGRLHVRHWLCEHWGRMTTVGQLSQYQSLTWGQLLCVLGQGLKPGGGWLS